MKFKLLFLSVFLTFGTCISIAQNQITMNGVVLTDDGMPIENVIVIEKGTTNAVVTDIKGVYTINVVDTSELVFYYEGNVIKIVDIQEYLANKAIVALDAKNYNYNMTTKVRKGGGSASMNNYWIGAKVGYNFIGETDDNFFVGSASIRLNVFDGITNNEQDKWKDFIAVIGNIGNFKFDKETDSSEDVQKVAQSINGLSVGFGYTKEYQCQNLVNSYWRLFGRTGVRMTTFDEIGEDQESINLAQFENNIGIEFEMGDFKNGGRLNAACGVTYYLFDKDVYNRIFEEERSSLFTFDATLILPVSKDLGFFINGTFNKQMSAAYILGIIFRS